MALAGLAVAFAACNLVLMHLLPVGPPAALLAWSLPYLGAGALAVLWMFRTQPMRTQLRVVRSVKSAATLLESWRPRVRRPPALHRSVTLVTGW